VIDDCRKQGMFGRPTGHAQHAGGERKQQKDAERRQQSDDREDIGLGLGAADEDGARGRDQREGEK
jgi:hypothetical protein